VISDIVTIIKNAINNKTIFISDIWLLTMLKFRPKIKTINKNIPSRVLSNKIIDTPPRKLILRLKTYNFAMSPKIGNLTRPTLIDIRQEKLKVFISISGAKNLILIILKKKEKRKPRMIITSNCNPSNM
jgi:hypothetical protein